MSLNTITQMFVDRRWGSRHLKMSLVLYIQGRGCWLIWHSP